MTQHHLIWQSVPEAELGGGAKKRILNGSAGAFATAFIKGGTFAASHFHEFEQVVFIKSGEGTLKTEQGSVRFSKGSVFHFPPGTWHEVQFDVDTEILESNYFGSPRGQP